MFDSLADQIKQEEGPPAKPIERFFRYAAVVLISASLFVGLYLMVEHLE
jgi:hypothetical protein